MDGKRLGRCLLGFYFNAGLLRAGLNKGLLLTFLLSRQWSLYLGQLGGLFSEIESHAFLGKLLFLDRDLRCLLLDYLVDGLRDDPQA